MKKILVLLTFLLFVASNAFGAFGMWTFNELTGGGAALDGRSAVSIEDDDIAYGVAATYGEMAYVYASASTAAESVPDVIVPNDAGATGRWILVTGAERYVQLVPTTAPTHSEGLFYYDSVKHAFTAFNEEADVAQQMGQEGWIRVYNDTGGDITDGQICYLSGRITDAFTVDLAIANDPAKCLGTIGFATHTIEDGTYGYITRWGELNNQNTLGETPVTRLWLSATSAGDYTATPPSSPYYLIGVGSMGFISETVGTIDVNVTIGTNTAGVIKIFNNAVLEDTDTTVASNGVDTVTLSYEQSGGGDLSLFFDASFTIFDSTPAATVNLSIGSDTSPTLNYVYIPKSTKTLTASTVGFPTTEQHVPVATVLVQSAASAATDGVYKVHAWTDHLSNGDDQGHLSHVNRWIREQHATWSSGGLLTPTITTNGGALDNVDISTSAASVLQLHDHSFPAFDTSTGSHVYVVNDATTAYKRITDLNAITEDSTGASLGSNNTYYSLVIWGSVSESAGDSQLYINLPSGFYSLGTLASNDANGYSNYQIPQDFKGTGFLIARLTLRYQTGDSGTITVFENEDLRGLVPSTSAGGGGTSGGSEFSDNVFRIQNVLDGTKQIAFGASGITTGTTRTITMPDADVDLGDVGPPEGTAVLSTGEAGGVKFLREDGDGTSSWQVPSGGGDVVGPASAVDGNIATYDGTTGKLLKDSGATIDASGLTLPAVAVPTDSFVDSDSLDADQTVARIYANATTVTAGAVVSDMTFDYKDGADASGVFTPWLILDGSDNQAEFQVNTTLQAGDIINAELNADAKYDAIEFVIDGGGSAITTGTKGYLEIPWNCTINSVTMLADQSGSAVVDLWVDTYANYPPLDADSITASAVPTITTAVKSQDTTLTGWTTSLTKGSIIGYNVDSASTIEFITISLKVDK